ncbi:putative serine protease K12H4.7 [Bombyx mori]|uniref:Serine protease K12H4.7 n=1 Tax=Bombyx mori TaxID=7091 RepID=A0A8R2QY60_BOMMO|nr:putative serine protease K12H4.7 [Bombyx mori]
MSTNMKLYTILFNLYVALISVDGVKKFHLGRSNGGNLGIPGGDYQSNLPPPQWFKQKLDHSNPSDLRTWKQRYYVNDSFYDFKNQGPVFLMIGGEGPADARWMVTGTWINYAKKFNALCINLEHRFYGESHPTLDLSIKNLQFLSSYQALADLANFISSMKQKFRLNEKVKWIAFGGSYPGSLAAWLRLKYPHLIHASISTSGPLLAKVDFKEYYQVVVDALREKTGDDKCVNELRQAHNEISQLIQHSPEVIEKEFRVCKPFGLASQNDMKNFYNSIADDFADLVQYNEDNRISADVNYKNLTINTVCDMLTATGGLPAYKKLAAFNDIVLAKSNETCMDYSYDNMISDLRNITWSSNGARQWMYQTCTEFGFYQTSSAEMDVFGNNFDVDFFIQQCQDVFGQKYNLNFVSNSAAWTNNYYGALKIAVGRIVFVHGSIDPWHALGITETKDNDSPAIFIHGTAHCANMYPASDNDLAELKQARIEIEKYLSKWLD